MADSFSLLIDDSSPVLSYFPFPDTLSIPNFFEGWNPCFSISACSTFPGQQGNGSSFHVTSQDGAAFSIQWWGNGIQLSGIAEGPVTYDLQLDGSTNSSISPSTSGEILLAEYGGLQPGNHTLSLIVHNPTNSTSALIAIDNALITVNSTSPNTTFSSSVIDDTSLPFTGQWSFVNNSLSSSLDNLNTYHTTTHAGDFVNFNFSGTAVSVFGFRGATSGNYSVKLDNDTVALNGASSSEVATTLFFRTGLNNSFHTLTITNVDNSLLAIGSINVTTASSQLVNPISGSSSHISRGTIVAIAVASTLGVLVFLIAAFFLWHRRRQFGRILHRKRLFVAPNGNDHSKVLDIVRGPDVDDIDDMYEDKPPEDKSRQPTNHGSESLSFTLDLPIQSRPSLRLSHRDWSGNSAQDLPRSPTVSVGRPGTHPRGSSRGVPLHEISDRDSVDNDETRRPASSIAPGQATDEGIFTTDLPRDRETVDLTGRRTFELTPVVSPPPLTRPDVVVSDPAQGGSDQSQPSFSFLDISASSQASSASVRHPGLNPSSSSSSFSSMRRSEPLLPSQRISLPFAMGFPRDPPDLSRAPPTGIEFPRISLNIRPLPQIPQSAVELGTQSSMFPTMPQRAVRPHAHSIPSLRVRTEDDQPQTLPRSVSTSTAPPISAVSGGNRVPNIVVHPSSLLRTHPRTSSVISPTESVPVTVSDIHFRHSSDDEPGEPESRRTSAAVSEHPPPHPPLPQRSYTSPFIMHKLFGTPAAPPTAPGDGEFSQQSPGAGPSRIHDRDPPPAGPSAARQKKRSS